MEDALVPFIPLSNDSTLGVGLNPCFNGRCTRTRVEDPKALKAKES